MAKIINTKQVVINGQTVTVNEYSVKAPKSFTVRSTAKAKYRVKVKLDDVKVKVTQAQRDKILGERDIPVKADELSDRWVDTDESKGRVNNDCVRG
jgi:ribosomal protein S4